MPDATLDLQGVAVNMFGGKQPQNTKAVHHCGVLREGKVSGLGGHETLSALGYWAVASLLFHLHTLTPEFQSFAPIRETLKNCCCHTAHP